MLRPPLADVARCRVLAEAAARSEMAANEHLKGNARQKKVGYTDDSSSSDFAALRARRLGLMLWIKGLPEEAAFEWRAAVTRSPNDALARCNLARALLEMEGGVPSALAQLRKATELCQQSGKYDVSDMPLLHLCLGMLHQLNGRHIHATEQLRESLRLRPNFAEARAALARALFERGDSKGAFDELEAAARLCAPPIAEGRGLPAMTVTDPEAFAAALYAKRVQMVEDAGVYQQTASDNCAEWFYIDVAAGHGRWQPPQQGYTSEDGGLVLADGEVLSAEEATLEVAEVARAREVAAAAQVAEAQRAVAEAEEAAARAVAEAAEAAARAAAEAELASRPRLRMTIVEAKGLLGTSGGGLLSKKTSDPFVQVLAGPCGEIARTRPIVEDLSSEWNDEVLVDYAVPREALPSGVSANADAGVPSASNTEDDRVGVAAGEMDENEPDDPQDSDIAVKANNGTSDDDAVFLVLRVGDQRGGGLLGEASIPIGPLRAAQGTSVDAWYSVRPCEGCKDATGQVRAIVALTPGGGGSTIPELFVQPSTAETSSVDTEKKKDAVDPTAPPQSSLPTIE